MTKLKFPKASAHDYRLTGTGCIVLSDSAFSVGADNIVGGYGFKITGYNAEERTLTLDQDTSMFRFTPGQNIYIAAFQADAKSPQWVKIIEVDELAKILTLEDALQFGGNVVISPSTPASGMVEHLRGTTAFAAGYRNIVAGAYSYAGGLQNIALRACQDVHGRYNLPDNHGADGNADGFYISIYGNGTSESRANAAALTWSGHLISGATIAPADGALWNGSFALYDDAGTLKLKRKTADGTISIITVGIGGTAPSGGSDLPITALGTSGTITIDRSVSDKFTMAPSASVTLAGSNFTNMKEAKLDILGGFSKISIPASWRGTLPTLSKIGINSLRIKGVDVQGVLVHKVIDDGATETKAKFVTVAGVCNVSVDGFTWNSVTNAAMGSVGKFAIWTGTRFICGGQGAAGWSADGVTWTTSTPATFTSANGACWNGSRVVMVGTTGGTVSMVYSDNAGTSWSNCTGTMLPTTNGVCWNGSRFVAVGNVSGGNTIVYSDNGIAWTAATASNTIFSTRGVAVCWNGSIFVATGEGTNAIATSPDGINWTGRGSPTAPGLAVCWNGSVFVAGGQSAQRIVYSSNGIDWTHSTSGTAAFNSSVASICWDGTKFVAGGSINNQIATSTDGITWVGQGTPTGTVNSVCSSNAPNLYPPVS